jgi:uncharacterized protein (DUF2345 family)
MSGGNIEIHAPGNVDFKATQKNWTSAKSDKPDPLTFARTELDIKKQVIKKVAIYPVSL